MLKNNKAALIAVALLVLVGVVLFVPSATIGARFHQQFQNTNKVIFKDQRTGTPVVFTDKADVEKIIAFVGQYRVARALPQLDTGWLYNIAFCKDENTVVSLFYCGKFILNSVAYRAAGGYSQEEFDRFMQSLMDN